MDLTKPSLRGPAGLDLRDGGGVKSRCEVSRAYAEAGDYERAREALGYLWQRVGERPVVDGLAPDTAAELLLQAGRLTSALGGARDVGGAQEFAKNLISESAALFERLGAADKVTEAQTELAVCYWREGAFDEARVLLREALKRLPGSDEELKATALIRLAIVERSSNRYDAALDTLREAAPIVEASAGDATKGKFHNELATLLENIARAERRPEKFDSALIEYAAASYHWEKAGLVRYRAHVENNLGFLFNTIGRHAEAHEHLERARSLFAKLKDAGSVAQVDDTRARVLIAEGRPEEAEKVARAAVRGLEAGGRHAFLAEALTTLGVAQARAGGRAAARESFLRAVETAEIAGDTEGAGLSALTLAEELGGHMTAGELRDAFERAADLVSNSKNPATLARLSACAGRVVRALSPSSASHAEDEAPASVEERWAGFSLKQEVLRYESELIERALNDAGGVVSRAAKLLGFRHHQTFVALLNNRHKSLLHARRPIVPRRRSIVKVREPRRTAHHRADRETRVVTILFVEDNRVVADAIRDTLELEGWRVEPCFDGGSALKKVEGEEHYDLLLLDEDLPGVSGLELTNLARGLPHRRATPIIIFSATNRETAARDAGADAFLRKPQDILALVPTINRLLDVGAAV
jgi:CheY-like chemotaxis protein/tetratricopeptide (TPR) repeat protein